MVAYSETNDVPENKNRGDPRRSALKMESGFVAQDLR